MAMVMVMVMVMVTPRIQLRHERSPQRDHRLLEEAEELKFVKDYMLWNEGKLDAYAKRAYDA